MKVAMLKLIVVYFLGSLVLQISADKMLGPGLWSLISVSKCDIEMDDEILTVDINKHKLNRTHDGITADVKCLDDIGDNYGGFVEICKYVDGGCKPYQVLTDESVVNMLRQYGKEENIVNALSLANVDPPDFPIAKGEYHADDFIMNYCHLPRDGVYGKFEGMGYLMRGSEKVGCVKAVLEFNRFDDEHNCDD